MTRKLEGLIRPGGDVNPPLRVVGPARDDSENIVIAFGKGASNSVKTISTSFSESITLYMEKQQKEETEPEEA